MNSRIKITSKNIENYFYLEKLTPEKPPVSFRCLIVEYNDYLFQDATRSLKDHIAKHGYFANKKPEKSPLICPL
jgi:hypothetical protein